jgi:Na+/H+-translocating membrane pyrophosphatase
MKQSRGSEQFLHKHSLSLVALGVVVLLIALYWRSNPSTHVGSFFGNAIADWTGVLVTVVMTKHLYEKGSAESKQPKGKARSAAMEFLREHSLTLFLLVTGIAWVVTFRAMDPSSRWGQVVGNIVSEWTQILGLVVMTKRLMEVGSKEGRP